MTGEAPLSATELVDKLSPIGEITSKKMFGGFGIFHDGKMFGIIDSKGGAFLKSDDSTKHEFESAGAEKHGRMPYYSIPSDILANTDLLIQWAKKSIDLA